MASVSLAGVSKVFPGSVWAVRDLKLEIQDHEFLVFLGPSGCGKSTTLRLIAGLEEVTTGEIRIGGSVVNDVPPKDRDIAMVFQNYALYPHLSVYKNIAFGLELRYGGHCLHRIWKRLTSPAAAVAMAAKRRGIRDEVRQTAMALGIERLLDRMPRQLSGGERQRVALGRAIVRHPAVFLFDEPLSNLDAKLRLEMRRELRELHDRLAATMVYVTHDQTEAMTLGDRIVVMDGGEIRQVGSPMEIYDEPASRFVAAFLGSPPMNFVDGAFITEGERLAVVGHGLRIPISKQKEESLKALRPNKQDVVLGVRPEDVFVEMAGDGEDTNCGRVSTVEPLGDCTLLHVAIAAGGDRAKNGVQAIVCKSEPRTNIEPGAAVRLRFSEQRLHLFDTERGDNLTRETV